jgi:hypothetical protein
VLRATTAFTSLTFQLPKVLRTQGVFSVLASKCASRIFAPQWRAIVDLSHQPKWLRTRCFSEPAFRPSGATKHWKKHSASRLFYLFAHLHHPSSDSFSSLIFSFLPQFILANINLTYIVYTIQSYYM